LAKFNSAPVTLIISTQLKIARNEIAATIGLSSSLSMYSD